MADEEKKSNGLPVNTEALEAYQARAARHKRIIRSFAAKENAKRAWRDRFIDVLVEWSGSTPIFIFHALWFFFWIIANLGFIPDVPIFDAYPFGLLTMIVSLEAIILSVFVLMSQGRQKRIDDLRAETALQVNLITEEEITKMMRMLALLQEHVGIKREHDAELEQMLKPLNTADIERRLEVQLMGKE